MRAPADFYDVKGDIEALLVATGARDSFTFEAASLPCLHPGRAARVLRQGREVGWIGELHPALVRELDLTYVRCCLRWTSSRHSASRGRHTGRSHASHRCGATRGGRR